MNEKLTLQELIDLLAARHQMEPQDAESFVKTFWALVEEGLKRDSYVKIKGLGTFKLIETEPRESIDVHSGERIEIQSHTRITFSPDVSLRDQINRPFSHFETVVLNEGIQFDDWDEKLGAEEEDTEDSAENEVEEGEEEVLKKSVSPRKVVWDDVPEDSIEDVSLEEPASSQFVFPEEELSAESAPSVRLPEENHKTFVETQIIEEELPLEDSKEVEEPSTACEVLHEEVAEGEAESQKTGIEELACDVHEEEKVDNEHEEVPIGVMEEEKLSEEHQGEKKLMDEEENVEEHAEKAGESDPSSESVQGKVEVGQSEREVNLSSPKQDQKSELEEGVHETSSSRPNWEADSSAKKKRIPWCMVSTVLLIGVILGGLVSWMIMSGRRYIPEDMVKSFLKAENELREQKELLADSLSIVAEMLADSTLFKEQVEDSLSKEKEMISEKPQATPVQMSEKPKQKTSVTKQTVKVLSDKVNYKITGTLGTHTIRKGDSLVKIALKFYGNKNLWTYIVKHNRKVITNPDNVPIGTTLLVPQLVPAE